MISYSIVTFVFSAASFAALAEASGNAVSEEMTDSQVNTSTGKSFAERLSKMLGIGQGIEIADEGEARNPRWFTTNHPSYQSIINNEHNQNQAARNLATLFCHTQSLYLCKYSDYCPDGAGNEIFAEPSSGGISADSLAPIQWAPAYSDEVVHDTDNTWVQVDHYGREEGKCWSYTDWTRGTGGDVEAKWGATHRMWILCCENVSEQEIWEMNNLDN